MFDCAIQQVGADGQPVMRMDDARRWTEEQAWQGAALS